ncbi:MAG: type III pantothenate kinase, partial [Victivallales bacterium]|nr:type III pantothenate kinase [Victivallales bacterium]
MKIGIVGLAHGHAQTYIKRWQENPDMDIQVARIWDPDKERLEDIAKNYNLEMGECPYCIVNDPEIEAVLIASETSRHAEYVEIAAEAGKKIVVQKPMALTIADADRIVNAAAVHFMYPGQNCLVLDFGTATTYDYVDADGTFAYTIISPGLEISAQALFNMAAK